MFPFHLHSAPTYEPVSPPLLMLSQKMEWKAYSASATWTTSVGNPESMPIVIHCICLDTEHPIEETNAKVQPLLPPSRDRQLLWRFGCQGEVRKLSQAWSPFCYWILQHVCKAVCPLYTKAALSAHTGSHRLTQNACPKDIGGRDIAR